MSLIDVCLDLGGRCRRFASAVRVDRRGIKGLGFLRQTASQLPLDLAFLSHPPRAFLFSLFPLKMFARTLFVALSLASAALASFPASYAMRGEFSALDRRASQPVAVACYTPNAGDCDCPQDNNEDVGVLINVFPVCSLSRPRVSSID
jgi:hypothetical protein